MNPRRILTPLLLCWAIQPAVADICSLDDSVKSCQERVADEIGVQLVAPLAEAADANVANSNTGAVQALLPGAGTKADFKSLVQFLIDSGALGEDTDEDDAAFAFDVTNFLGLNALNGYKVQFVGRDAGAFQAVQDAIPEDDRAATVAKLEESLDRLSDTSLILSFNPTFARRARGRNPDNYRSELLALWSPELAKRRQQGDADDELETAFAEALQAAPVTAQQRQDLLDGETTFRTALGEGEGTQDLVAKLEASARAFFGEAKLGAAAAAAQGNALTQFSKLIDNQPQWVFSVEQTYRDPLAGPDELKLKGSYEYGFANVRALKAYCAKKEELKAPEKLSDCMKAYFADEAFLKNNTLEDRVNAGHRMALTVDYSEVDDYKFDAGDDLDEVTKKGDHEVKVSLGYSRYLNLGKAIGPNTRFDLSYTYEDSGSDKAKNDRHIGQAILSIPAANKTFFTVGVKYSSDPKFVGEVDKELSTRVGLVFKPFQPEEPAEP